MGAMLRPSRAVMLLAAIVGLLLQACGQRWVPGAGADASTIVSRDATADRALPPVASVGVCEPECLEQRLGYGTLCVKALVRVPDVEENLFEERCVACVSDEHCRLNPNSWAPRCDVERHLCFCDGDEDCTAGFPGMKCMGTGIPEGPICGCPERGPSEACPPDKVCHPGGACEPPCGPEDCLDSGLLCDQRRDSTTFGLCVECLTDADCGPEKEGFTCNRSFGDCGCTEDADCAGHPRGSKCHVGCVHHAGPAACRSSCACEDDDDCPYAQRCAEDWPRRCVDP